MPIGTLPHGSGWMGITDDVAGWLRAEHERDQGWVVPSEILAAVEARRENFPDLADVDEIRIVDTASFEGTRAGGDLNAARVAAGAADLGPLDVAATSEEALAGRQIDLRDRPPTGDVAGGDLPFVKTKLRAAADSLRLESGEVSP